MSKYRWGILATGHIAGKLAMALTEVEEAELVAVASRSDESANEFGDRWNIPRRYGSYELLAADEDVDIIYIATPHRFHADNMKLCLNAGKHVLCEKPLTLNANEARECIELAREKKRFLMEAVWMRFTPAMAQVDEWVKQGRIGEVRLVQADFCFERAMDPQHRLFNPELGGGALLDVGIYPLTFTTRLLGFPDSISGQAQVGQSGVDEINALTLTYGARCTAQLASSVRVYKPQEAFIVGSEGWIKVHEPFYCADRLSLHPNGAETENISVPFKGNGYPHEILEVHRCLDAGQLESQLMPLDETLKMMQLMDRLRNQWGVRYPGEA